MKIKVFYDGLRQFVWVVRLVHAGDHYGVLDECVHEEADPLVEFFDPRYSHTDLGQFVSRYYASTLKESKSSSGLCLYGGVPSWELSASVFDEVRAWLAAVT